MLIILLFTNAIISASAATTGFSIFANLQYIIHKPYPFIRLISKAIRFMLINLPPMHLPVNTQ